MTVFFGRKQLLRRVAELHSKAVPDHISVVGPRAIGKSVLLRAVLAEHASGSTVFAGAGVVDLRHDPPTTVEGVLARVASTLKEALEGSPEFGPLAQYIRPSDATGDLYDQLNLAIGEVTEAGKRVLVILDGCDPVLQNSAIPRNLWDNLRALAQNKGLRLMTGSRAPLHELCYNPDSRTSDFFGIFYDEPLHVGAFDDEDWTDIFARATPTLDPSAQKELRNWTGGYPELVGQMLERLAERKKSPVAKPDVDACAESMLESSATLAALWSQCSEDSRRDILALCSGDLSVNDIPEDRLRYLVARGLAVKSGTKVRLSNRLIERKAAAKKGDVSGIHELFGTPDAFNSNVAKMLELRLALAQSVDATLGRTVARAIRDLHDDPGACLSGARDILDRALDLVWACEAPDLRVPSRWIQAWREQQTSAATKAIERVTREPAIPDERGAQCDLIRLAMGSQGLRPVGLKISRAAFVLIDHMRHVGNLKNHSKAPTNETFAAAFCLAAIELCETLARDLAPS